MPVNLVTASETIDPGARGNGRRIVHESYVEGPVGFPFRHNTQSAPIVQVPTVEDLAILAANSQEQHQAERTSREQEDLALGMRLDALNDKFETTVAPALGEELREAMLAEFRQEVALMRQEVALMRQELGLPPRQ